MSTAADHESSTAPTDLEAWKQVHSTLTEAVQRAQEAVNIRKAQRRFWMEEICSNMTVEGKLKSSSVWKRPLVLKKTAKRSVAAKPAGTKRKKKDPNDPKQKKPRKKKSSTDDGDPDAPRSKKIKIGMKKKTDSFFPQPEEDESETSQEESSGMQQAPAPREYVQVPPPGAPWGPPGGQNPLQMMAAVAAFGANPNGYPPPMMQQQPYNPFYPPPHGVPGMPPHGHGPPGMPPHGHGPPGMPPGMPPRGLYPPPPHGPPPPNMRAYASIQDAGKHSDEDSHEDKF